MKIENTIFKPYFVQAGQGPHLLDWAYCSDENWDPFLADIPTNQDGVVVENTHDIEKYGINVRYNVENFGYLFLTADNGGEFYQSSDKREYNLNYELAKSRVVRNRTRLKKLQESGWKPSPEVNGLVALSEQLLEDGSNVLHNSEKCAGFAQRALLPALQAGEKMELDQARFVIKQAGHRPDFFIGCDARGYLQMDPDLFLERFMELFNYATITHYLKSNHYQDFEPREGEKQFNLRTVLHKELIDRGITVEGRPLFWFYNSTTPDWLRNKSYKDLLKYVESHAREVVSHYGDGMYAWEVMNEAHDWANELQLKPEQITEVTRLACDVARDTNPKVHRLINNCCPFAEYVQLKKWGEIDACYKQRTPHQFLRELVEAEVDFTITGQQMYFPYRDLQDTILLIERLEQFGRPVQLTEVGTSSGLTKEAFENGRLKLPEEPYIWHRYWDDELQADWMEGLYTLAYSKEWIEAVNWYDFIDQYSWIKNGGLLRSPEGERKPAFERLLKLQREWKSLG
ncbi:MAG: endo-1,4-beta-xylanase [Candidatus Marinimicrobia bacterium]|nr:endo-1,4-beta-xylanase [Candidatus Neomarinimicrobiota bacterium]